MKTKPMYVVCFYWQGERWREDDKEYYPVDDPSYIHHLKRSGSLTRELVCRYVNNLYIGVSKWAVHPFKFICFTNDQLDVNKEIELRPFTQVTNMGVLPRMYMFSEEAGLFGHQVLSLDIDVIITGSLRDIMNYNGMFCVRKRWLKGQEHLPDGDIISFTAGKATEKIFWTPFVADIAAAEESTKGRERYWITHVIKNNWEDWDSFAPGQVCSYKHHIKRNGLQNARIVSCHGAPRPHIIDEKWREKNWENG